MGYVKEIYYKVGTFKFSYPHIKDNLVLCHKCLKYLIITDFYVQKELTYRMSCSRKCKYCINMQYQKRKKDCKGYGLGIHHILNHRFLALRYRSKSDKLDFDTQYLQELWNKQEGKCALSGIAMTFLRYTGRISTNVSVDRIDSQYDYRKNNIQLVCMAVNQMKNDLIFNDFLYFCENIVKHSRLLKH